MNKKWFTLNMELPIPEVLVNGYIGANDQVNYADFKNAIDQIKAAGYTRAKLKLNTGGGEMFEGFAIYDYAMQSGILFEVEIIGVAASMGSVLMLIANELPDISEHGRVMLHNPKSFIVGEAESMEEHAQIMKALRTDVIAVFMAKTGKDEATVESWFVRGKDTWFTAKEAKKAGLVRNIIKGSPAPKNAPPKNASERDVWQVYNLIVTNQNSDMLSVTMLAKLALPKDATASDIEAKVNSLLDEKDGKIASLTNKVTDLEKAINDAASAATAALKAKGETFFNKLVEAKKITADKKEKFVAAYIADADSIEEVYGNVAGVGGIQVGNTGGAASGAAKPKNAWTVADYQLNNAMDELEQLRVSNKAEYDAVFARYNKELKEKTTGKKQ